MVAAAEFVNIAHVLALEWSIFIAKSKSDDESEEVKAQACH